jgi:hypothetical protein
MSDPIPQTAPFAYALSVFFSDEQVIALARLLRSRYHGGLPFVRIEAALEPFDLALKAATDDHEAQKMLKCEVRRQLEEAFVLTLVNQEFQGNARFGTVVQVLLCAQQRAAARVAELEAANTELRAENKGRTCQADMLNTMMALQTQPHQ